MTEFWGRVTPKVKATNTATGKAIKSYQFGYSLTRGGSSFFGEPGYVFFITLGNKRQVAVEVSETDIRAMLDEIEDRKSTTDPDPRELELMGLPPVLQDEEDDDCSTCDCLACAFDAAEDEASDDKPEVPSEQSIDWFMSLLNSLIDKSEEKEPDDQRAVRLLRDWGWGNVVLDEDGHRIWAGSHSGPTVWHIPALLRHADTGKSAVWCPVCLRDTMDETL